MKIIPIRNVYARSIMKKLERCFVSGGTPDWITPAVTEKPMQIRYAPKPLDIGFNIFVFDLENETLIDADNAVRTDAISGPYGKGPLPKGQYMMKPAVLIDADDEGNKGFMDKRGLAWWAALVPCFKTNRTSLGIHPDGNVEGTLGCIGLTMDDTRSWFQRLEKPAIVLVV